MMSKKWYVVHAYSGFEKSVQRALVDRIQRAGMADKFGQILVPVEEVVEMKSGKKVVTTKLTFPGYILVEMDMTRVNWHLVKNTAKVTVSSGAREPSPRFETEVRTYCTRSGGRGEAAPEVCSRSARRARQGKGPLRTSTATSKTQLRQEHAARVGDDLRALHPVELISARSRRRR